DVLVAHQATLRAFALRYERFGAALRYERFRAAMRAHRDARAVDRAAQAASCGDAPDRAQLHQAAEFLERVHAQPLRLRLDDLAHVAADVHRRHHDEARGRFLAPCDLLDLVRD